MMKQRCNNPNQPKYKGYGGRGIKVCNGWQNSFESFYLWAMSNGYSEELSIDRIDVNGNYVIEPKFYDGEMFASNGLAGVRDKNGLWGYIDETGEYVIEPKYEYAGVFADGLAPVRYTDGSWAYIRENGETAFDLSCEYANEFYEGHAVIKKDDRMQYFIDTNGNILSSDGDLDDYYNHVNNIGIERAKGENGLWGYVGTDGAWVILPCYEYAGDFDSVGRVAVVKDPEH
jgi:hypothetical protein